MKNIILLGTLFLLLQPINIAAQVSRQNGLSITIQGPNTEIEGIQPEDASSKTQHLRFINADYKEAQVNALKEAYYLRYNIFRNEMEFIKEGKNYFLTKIENQSIHFVDANRTFTALNIDGELQYVEINYKGNTSLYTLQQVIFKKGKVAITQFETAKKAKFIRDRDIHYIALNNAGLEKLPKGKKNFYQLFSDKSKAIKNYLKKEKINREKTEDIIKVIKHYHSL
jgi:hypothetical protein